MLKIEHTEKFLLAIVLAFAIIGFFLVTNNNNFGHAVISYADYEEMAREEQQLQKKQIVQEQESTSDWQKIPSSDVENQYQEELFIKQQSQTKKLKNFDGQYSGADVVESTRKTPLKQVQNKISRTTQSEYGKDHVTEGGYDLDGNPISWSTQRPPGTVHVSEDMRGTGQTLDGARVSRTTYISSGLVHVSEDMRGTGRTLDGKLVSKTTFIPRGLKHISEIKGNEKAITGEIITITSWIPAYLVHTSQGGITATGQTVVDTYYIPNDLKHANDYTTIPSPTGIGSITVGATTYVPAGYIR
ncbi:hypothetical protein COV18_06965 [Candidatus Woesearchaeota archaeon CG10_big_fil_rev_8_21_14_0_10_37_12]|nr:MAG: hypothetical protein COV18_06965 [Candidatus Woesearchaeota archaeon CG10_big_fil_rev_8_21_14_0_10_37_12]